MAVWSLRGARRALCALVCCVCVVVLAPAAGAATNNIFTVAGTLTMSGSTGDGGPATAAKLNFPTGVAATADGGFLIADRSNYSIRRVSPAGTITPVAGTLTVSGSSGDGGPATAAKLSSPSGVAATADGGFLIADANNHAIRRVSPASTITTVAGTLTTAGSSGDGGPATAAKLNSPTGVAASADGGFLIADFNNHAIRRVSPAGTITTVAGTLTTSGSTGDGGPATAAKLNGPTGVAASADGGFLIADQSNHAIRFVDADLRGPGSVPAGAGGPAGATGAIGAGGPQGPAGSPGAPGRDARFSFSCKLARASAAAKRKKKKPSCVVSVKRSSGASAIRARLHRGRRSYASGAGAVRGGRARVRLHKRRALGRGSYTLTVDISGPGGTTRWEIPVIFS